ncbi:iron uptake system protein EfeO [Synechococcus sp. PCC 6312]|uniref:iron uptake system protein EfeO n=1 Tax=Synechococcus sp. (strain ATCC 27167 / PCC 6312) TaxID=195253 RepID=UPI00029EDFFD|nr:iron uptake system protein EfeO [Synechococcus sp. PCC 6312]AFY60493.1 putative periplasmic lipoprotein involved in iron transport [Synechococcus sp. PCC 6312]
MSRKTKLWLGVGTYVLTGLTPVLQLPLDAALSPVMAQSAPVTVDPCRKGLGGEGGRGVSEGGEGGESGSQSATLNPAIQPQELQQAVDQYKAYVLAETNRLLTDSKVFTERVIAGDLAGAQAMYAPSRLGWERIEPIAESFAEFDRSIDARVDDFKGEDDPEFTGFHRIEMGLFKYNTTKGYAGFAQKLMTDLEGLKTCIVALEIDPRDMVRGTSELIEEVAQGKVTGEEERYSRTDFWAFQANVEGSQKIVEILRPLIQRVNPTILGEIDQDFAAVNQVLAKYALPGGGFKSYDQLTLQDKQRLQADLARLAENLAKLRGVIGV